MTVKTGTGPSRKRAIAIGVSAGGVEILNRIFRLLPKPFSVPIFVTLHVAPHTAFIPAAFNGETGLEVKEAEDKEVILPARVYFAAADYHLLIEKNDRLSLSSEEPVHFARPSIDVMFQSAADTYGPGLLGIVLTGANEDGAEGLEWVKREGGTTVVQDPATSAADTMPKAAIKRLVPDHIFSPDAIAEFMTEWSRRS